MIKDTNLVGQIKKQLPAELIQFMQMAGDVAAGMGQKLYLVGGVVRDLILERKNLDLDLVAEGDAIALAEELAKLKKGRVIAHSRFNTAKIKWDKWTVDIATTRAETYEKSGSLPVVRCGGDIENDLVRRDFSINAMAVYLDPSHYGELIDLYRGREDLEKGRIRVLHDYSFRDDATRIWRAVRYEQRLDFKIERHTLDLLKRDISYLDVISGDRIRHELELVLEEERPEKALLRADELGLLARMSPAVEAGLWLAKMFTRARGLMQPYSPPEELYLAFLVYRLSPEALEDWIAYLKFTRSVSQILQETLHLKNELPCLAAAEMTPSQIHRCLHRYHQVAILANLMESGSPLVRQRIELYLNKLRFIHPAITGADLMDMGMASGPRIKEVLEILREARLDGKVASREEELKLIKTSRSF